MRLKPILVLGGGGGSSSAAGVSFDNSGVSLAATSVQDALEELAGISGVSNSKVDDQTNTLTELAALPTTGLTPPVVRIIYNTDDFETQNWVLLASTAATASGVTQRPDDYASSTNEKVWHRS